MSSIAATSEGGLDAVATIARTEIVPEISGIDGVAKVDLTGGLEERLSVTLDPDKLAESGVSTQQIVGILQANNLTFPSGQLSTDGSRTPVSTIGRFTSVEEVSGLVVGFTKAPTAVPPTAPAPGASAAPSAAPFVPEPITLGDLGTVEIDAVATTGFGRTNGNPSLSLTVSKTAAANTVEVAEAVQAKLAEIGERHAADLTITTVSDVSTYIIESRDGLVREGGLGAFFAILTIFAFLLSVRSTIVAAISIPLSIFTALVIMQLTGITINIMTLGGLAVAVGRVVDDAIVVLENIYRHRAMGEDRMTASINGPREVAGAITASTLTTVAVFLPLGFVGGLVSQFFLPFALTVTFALLASLVCALTVVPVLAYLLIDKVKPSVDKNGEPTNSLWVRAYTPTITFALRGRWTKLGVIAMAAILFVVTTAIVPQPAHPVHQCRLGEDPGRHHRAADGRQLRGRPREVRRGRDHPARRRRCEARPDDRPRRRRHQLPGLPVRPERHPGQQRHDDRAPRRTTADLVEATARLTASLEPVKSDGYDVIVGSAGGFTSNGLTVIVSGPDPVAVEEATAAVVAALADEPGLDQPQERPGQGHGRDPDHRRSQQGHLGRPHRGPGRGRGPLGPGRHHGHHGHLRAGQADLARGPGGSGRDHVGRGPARPCRSAPIATVPLGDVATVEQADVQGSITRINEAPAATINAEITSDDTGAVSQSVQAEIDALEADGQIPAGVTVELAGVSQQQSEAFGGLFASMAVAILLVYLMMVLAFNSLITPFVILFTLPLATIGAFPALLITGRPIGISALIGFLMLIGIVVTNAIVLLDLVERLRREQGYTVHDALVEGGRTRVRPILMTAIATILALMPLAAGFNSGSIIAAELGTVVIGGLFSATFLTLIVVPVVYSLVEGLRWRLGGRGRRKAKSRGGGRHRHADGDAGVIAPPVDMVRPRREIPTGAVPCPLVPATRDGVVRA